MIQDRPVLVVMEYLIRIIYNQTTAYRDQFIYYVSINYLLFYKYPMESKLMQSKFRKELLAKF
jgi:hypothetical protein